MARRTKPGTVAQPADDDPNVAQRWTPPATYKGKQTAERDAADLALEQYQDYQTRFVPLETYYQQQLGRIRDDRPLALGMANADTQQAFSDAGEQVRTNQFAGGVNPNSGKAVMSLADMGAARGEAGARAGLTADQTTEDRYWAGQNKLISVGRGKADDANLGLRTSASLASASSIAEAQNQALRSNLKYDFLGTLAGAGTRYAINR